VGSTPASYRRTRILRKEKKEKLAGRREGRGPLDQTMVPKRWNSKANAPGDFKEIQRQQEEDLWEGGQSLEKGGNRRRTKERRGGNKGIPDTSKQKGCLWKEGDKQRDKKKNWRKKEKKEVHQ